MKIVKTNLPLSVYIVLVADFISNVAVIYIVLRYFS